MTDDYTPTTEEVRALFATGNRAVNDGGDEWYAERDANPFDRWLAAEKRKWQAEALREAAEDWEALVIQEKPPIRGSVWLNRRADRIAGEANVQEARDDD